MARVLEAGSGSAAGAAAVPTPLSVIVPVFNEREGIRQTVEALRRVLDALPRETELVVVDDGSSDGTAAILDELGVASVRHEVNLGYGAALKSGILRSRHPLVAILDGDATYPADALPRLLAHMDRHDMVVGARTGNDVHVPAMRRPAKWILTRLAHFLSGHRVPDLNSGFRVFRRELAERFFGLFPDGFSFTTTITLAALTNGYAVGFEPIDYYRRRGRSAIRPVRDFLGFLLLVVRLVVYFRPLNVFLPASLLLFGAGAIKAGIDVYRQNFIGVGAAVAILVAIQIAFLGLLADLIMRRTRL